LFLQVHFLHEDRLLGALHGALSTCLRGANASRTFLVASLQPSLADPSGGLLAAQGARASKVRPATGDRGGGAAAKDEAAEVEEATGGMGGDSAAPVDIASFAAPRVSASSSSSRVSVDLRGGEKAKRPFRADNKLVRADSRAQSLEAFLVPVAVPQSLATPSVSPSVSSSVSAHKRARPGPSAEDEDEDEADEDEAEEVEQTNAYGGSAACVVHGAGSAVPGAFAARCNCRNPATPRAAAARLVAGAAPASPGKRSRPLVESTCTYASVVGLIAQVKSGSDRVLSGLLRRHVFVGVADYALSLVQCDTKLLLANHQELARELFFQLAVRR
jgi:DNA mismatch repair protein MLH1